MKDFCGLWDSSDKTCLELTEDRIYVLMPQQVKTYIGRIVWHGSVCIVCEWESHVPRRMHAYAVNDRKQLLWSDGDTWTSKAAGGAKRIIAAEPPPNPHP